MKIEISTLNAELIDSISYPPRILLRFGDAPIAEWKVPEEDRELVTATANSAQPTEGAIREYLEAFVAGKLAALFQGSTGEAP